MKKDLHKILHVEDEPDIRTITKVALEKIGQMVVASCASGPEALEIIADFSPDMVLLDAMMPGMDGPEVMAHLQNRDDTKDIPVVFMTAKVQASEIASYISLGALDVISKPIDPMKLHQQLKDIWAILPD